jgi:hypothetical protein
MNIAPLKRNLIQALIIIIIIIIIIIYRMGSKPPQFVQTLRRKTGGSGFDSR